MKYKYLVRYGHINENTEDVVGGIHHGPGEMEITTYEPIETQQDRDDVATTVGRTVHEKYGITGIAVQAIIPLTNDDKVIEVEDFSFIDHPLDSNE